MIRPFRVFGVPPKFYAKTIADSTYANTAAWYRWIYSQ